MRIAPAFWRRSDAAAASLDHLSSTVPTKPTGFAPH